MAHNDRARTGSRQSGGLDAVSARRLGIIVLLLAVIVGAWVYRAAGSGRVSRYLEATDAIQEERASAVDELTAVVAEFSGEPTSAAATADAFGQQAEAFEGIRQDLAAVEVPAGAGEYHAALDETYQSYIAWCEELARVAGYIELRGEILTSLSVAITEFDSRVTAAGSNDDVIAASVSLKDAADQALGSIRSLDRPELLAYSSETLEANVGDLASASERLGLGVESLDAEAVSAAVAELRDVLARDWALAVQETDLEGSTRYTEAQVTLAEKEESALAARSLLVSGR